MEISTHGVLNIISLIKSRPVPDSFLPQDCREHEFNELMQSTLILTYVCKTAHLDVLGIFRGA